MALELATRAWRLRPYGRFPDHLFMRTKCKVAAIIDDNPGIVGDLSRLLSASGARGRLWRRGHHLDSDALYLDSQRLSDPFAQRFGDVAQARRPRRAHDADGELSVL